MSGLTYDQLAQVYELRHGLDKPTPWKIIARLYPTSTARGIRKTIERLQREGLKRGHTGEKTVGRPRTISDSDLAAVAKARRAGFSWHAIAARMGVSANTLISRWHRSRA